MRAVSAERVYVETPMFSGWAKVVGYCADPLYPIIVELEDGDDDGHSYKRVGKNEVFDGPQNGS